MSAKSQSKRELSPDKLDTSTKKSRTSYYDGIPGRNPEKPRVLPRHSVTKSCFPILKLILIMKWKILSLSSQAFNLS